MQASPGKVGCAITAEEQGPSYPLCQTIWMCEDMGRGELSAVGKYRSQCRIHASRSQALEPQT